METTGCCVRPWFWPKKIQQGGGGCRKKKIKFFRVRFFVFFFLMLSKLPPLGFELKAAIYRQSVFSGFKIGPSIFEFGP
jgi:hypothetical protein